MSNDVRKETAATSSECYGIRVLGHQSALYQSEMSSQCNVIRVCFIRVHCHQSATIQSAMLSTALPSECYDSECNAIRVL